MSAPPLLLITDLDGTLIDRQRYDPGPAAEEIARAAALGVAIAFCSTKTGAEQRELADRLGIEPTLIVENGGAIELAPILGGGTIELGVGAAEIREALHEIRRDEGLAFRMFTECAPDEVAAITGLAPAAARRALRRAWSETLLGEIAPDERRRLDRALAERGLAVRKGTRFLTVSSRSTDKGTAVRRLRSVVDALWGPIEAVGLGDAENDLPLLDSVDRGFLVAGANGCAASLAGANVERIPAPGPLGWVLAVAPLLDGIVARRGGSDLAS